MNYLRDNNLTCQIVDQRTFLLYGVYDVLISEVSNGDKVFFTIFIGCIIAVYVVIMVLMWKNRCKGRKQ